MPLLPVVDIDSRKVIVMTEASKWMWKEAANTTQAQAICQKVIPVFSHFYLAALPSNVLSVTNSALISASHAFSQPGWITAEMIFNSAGQEEQENFLGQQGLQYRMIIGAEKRSLLVRSTQPLYATLTLWHHDLTAISSSLLVPVFTYGVSESRLAYPSPGDVSLGISSLGDSTVQLDIAVSGGQPKATFSIGEFQYQSWY
ncbi:hypothetical protein ElyMa_004948500 [Elysia marginata]|uniref:Uncharacterized protein n=1 Tax=Elysia marginata TaxID=1093978 RepID=A0AAV4J1B8_9GAST|nr:hypothetical protein ElyMa_004948500 [Elysia marginata]